MHGGIAAFKKRFVSQQDLVFFPPIPPVFGRFPFGISSIGEMVTPTIRWFLSSVEGKCQAGFPISVSRRMAHPGVCSFFSPSPQLCSDPSFSSFFSPVHMVGMMLDSTSTKGVITAQKTQSFALSGRSSVRPQQLCETCQRKPMTQGIGWSPASPHGRLGS